MTPKQLQRQYERIKRRYENVATNAVYMAIRKQKAPVIRIAKNEGLLQAWMAVNNVSAEPILKTLQSMFRVIMTREAERVYNSLIKQGTQQKSLASVFGVNEQWLADVEAFLAQYGLENIANDITDTTKARLLKTLVNGIRGGLSYSEIVSELQDSGFDKVRARLIARTESNASMSAGHHIGAKSLPFKVQKQWLSANDFRVRGRADGDDTSSHWGLNGVIVGENEPFIDPRNGDRLMFPGDRSLGAGADSICNCRCSTLYLPVKDADGKTIPR